MEDLTKVEGGSLSRKSGVVLVVDDEPDARAIISYALEKFGYELIQAENGEQALEICRQTLPDMIITDIMMPKMDGREFLSLFREEFSTHFVPVLMLTAKGDVQDLIAGLEGGADDYLTKPFNYKELVARVHALLRVKELTEELWCQREELEAKNKELSRMQEELLKKERQLVAMQLAGAATHNLGQPVTAILLNCRVLETAFENCGKDASSLVSKGLFSKGLVSNALQAISAIRKECEFMREVLTKLRSVDADRTENYLGDVSILSIENKNDS